MLHIHRAERADKLADALGELLAQPPEDPFTPEVIAVPTRGLERWLSQRLSGRLGTGPGGGDGVCANVLFPFPRRLIGDALAAASGVDPDEDPWLPTRSMWALLEVIDACAAEPWMRTLAVHLGMDHDPPDPTRQARRLGVAAHLADLFDRYALHRPTMVRAWSSGEDGDGEERLRPAARWQPELWRALRAWVGVPGPAERLEAACARLRADGAMLELPERVSLFGLTRLPAGELHVLRALAGQRDVHLFLLHPSPALWRRMAGRAEPSAESAPRRQDMPATAATHPLLSSWGRDAREMQLVLARGPEAADHHYPLALSPSTLLERIQLDVLADRAPPGAPFPGQTDRRAVLEPGDRSIQIHSCHGRARQVEVLRDAILHTLADDLTLEPRDVIVMCPDIETFAPLIQATFGAAAAGSETDSSQDLRVRLADRSLRQTNGVLAVVAELLALADQRLTASQVLDLAAREPVRRRFGFDDEDLVRMQDWIRDTGIRWGLDGAHRAPFKLGSLDSGTWRAGLDRLLLGVTMTEDGERLFAGVLALDDVDSGMIDLAGRLAELVARLREAVDSLSVEQPITSWAQSISVAADSLTATATPEAWQRDELQRLLDELLAEVAGIGAARDRLPDGAIKLSLAEVRGLLAERLAGRPTRANFRTGHLTICTLYPMRSVPHRVVCLLGLDDGAFPRKAPRDGDNLMLDQRRIGERDPRSEDRQLLLDALMASTERLIITYTGNDERTNTVRPPAVPVGELLEVIDATVRSDGVSPRDQALVRHPLQPFDPRNFELGALVARRRWSFDQVALGGAQALSGSRSDARPFLTAPLPPAEDPVIPLEDLVRFVQHPVRAFLRQRLRITVGAVKDEIDDALPVELDGLQRWEVGERLLRARLAGVDGHRAIQAEIARGLLPPSVLGKPVIFELYPVVEAIFRTAQALQRRDRDQSHPLDVHVELPGGRLLSGTVSSLGGDLLLFPTYSRINPSHRLGSWVRLLAATASDPQRALSAAAVGRGAGRQTVCLAQVQSLGADVQERRRNAELHLAALVDLYERGMREPLPLPCLSAAAYVEAATSGRDPAAAAYEQWTSAFDWDREDRHPEHRLVFGGQLSFEELSALAPRADESGPGWEASEASRFGRLAQRLWHGLLIHEQVSTTV